LAAKNEDDSDEPEELVVAVLDKFPDDEFPLQKSDGTEGSEPIANATHEDDDVKPHDDNESPQDSDESDEIERLGNGKEARTTVTRSGRVTQPRQPLTEEEGFVAADGAASNDGGNEVGRTHEEHAYVGGIPKQHTCVGVVSETNEESETGLEKSETGLKKSTSKEDPEQAIEEMNGQEMPNKLRNKMCHDQGHKTNDSVRCILLETNECESSGERTRLYTADRMKPKEIRTERCPTGIMIADYFTKSQQGQLPREMRNMTMGNMNTENALPTDKTKVDGIPAESTQLEFRSVLNMVGEAQNDKSPGVPTNPLTDGRAGTARTPDSETENTIWTRHGGMTYDRS
jgi:hypothetical protein